MLSIAFIEDCLGKIDKGDKITHIQYTIKTLNSLNLVDTYIAYVLVIRLFTAWKWENNSRKSIFSQVQYALGVTNEFFTQK